MMMMNFSMYNQSIEKFQTLVYIPGTRWLHQQEGYIPVNSIKEIIFPVNFSIMASLHPLQCIVIFDFISDKQILINKIHLTWISQHLTSTSLQYFIDFVLVFDQFWSILPKSQPRANRRQPSQLFIACQVRQGDLQEFLSHENHSWSPSLSVHGKLCLPYCKSELLTCLSEGISDVPDLPIFDAKVFDGAAVLHSLSKGDAVTFADYSSQVFIPWTLRELTACPRIDIVWDVYKSDSLKEATRQKRGKGIRQKVSPQTKIPRDFAGFLWDSRNKQELFDLLSEHVGSH